MERNNSHNERHLVDLGLALNPIDRLNFLVSFDYGYEENAIGSQNAHWTGAFVVARYKVTEHFEPAFRVEYYNDPQGFTTGVDQDLLGLTLTLNYRFDLPGGFHLLLRPEYRYDHSSSHFFTKGDNFRGGKEQHTLGMGVVLYY